MYRQSAAPGQMRSSSRARARIAYRAWVHARARMTRKEDDSPGAELRATCIDAAQQMTQIKLREINDVINH